MSVSGTLAVRLLWPWATERSACPQSRILSGASHRSTSLACSNQNKWDRPDSKRRARNTHRPMQMRKIKLSIFESDILPITIAQRAKRYEMLVLWEIRLRENKQIYDQLKTMKLSKLISYNRYLWNSLKSSPNLYSETNIQYLLMLVTFYW